MFKTLIASGLVVALCVTQAVFGQELTIGSKAPKLEVKKFIKGNEVKNFEQGKIYVVELWATWCGPCRTTIPHLTELQKKHKEVTIIGVAIMEEDQTLVPDFVEEMGKQMDYRVAIDLVAEDGDPMDGKVVTNWMKPADQQGIPTAFIINGDGRIAWIGHPGEMEEPLEKIVDGTWDLAAATEKMAEVKAAQRQARAMQKKLAATFGKLQQLFKQFSEDGDPKELMTALDTATEEIPERADDFQLVRFQVLSLVKDHADDAITLGNKIVDSERGKDAQLLNGIAWIIVDPSRETKADEKLLKFALKIAAKADKLAESDDASIADTLAKAYFDNGELAKAVVTQKRVIELAAGTQMEADPGLKKRLRQYQKALDASKEKDNVDTPAKPKK
jgi:thiol-disulfide isomerase/thioredoxin